MVRVVVQDSSSDRRNCSVTSDLTVLTPERELCPWSPVSLLSDQSMEDHVRSKLSPRALRPSTTSTVDTRQNFSDFYLF